MNRPTIILSLAAMLTLSSMTIAHAADERDLAFERKSAQWMQQTRDADSAEKAGNYIEAERIYKTIISDRINYHLDLSSERYGLARVYQSMGKNDLAEAMLKINLKQREEEEGPNGYTVQFPLNEYSKFLEKSGRIDEAKAMKARADAIELAFNGCDEVVDEPEPPKTKPRKAVSRQNHNRNSQKRKHS